ncbi:hypothetical protein ACIQV2_30060 [Streptomyces globosus]|uniref:hypothetical protein n=1 Tax=Streptomyces globosus TaxID=68209 RepID=UPI0038130B19
MIDDARDMMDDWESIYQGYFLGEHDETLLECVERLEKARAARPRDPETTAFHTLGLVWTYAHASSEADSAVARRVVEALSAAAADPAAGQSACRHESHPCDDDLEAHLESFEVWLSLLAGESDYTWDDLDGRPGTGTGRESSWRCPRNVAGFARSAADEIRRHRNR